MIPPSGSVLESGGNFCRMCECGCECDCHQEWADPTCRTLGPKSSRRGLGVLLLKTVTNLLLQNLHRPIPLAGLAITGQTFTVFRSPSKYRLIVSHIPREHLDHDGTRCIQKLHYAFGNPSSLHTSSSSRQSRTTCQSELEYKQGKPCITKCKRLESRRYHNVNTCGLYTKSNTVDVKNRVATIHVCCRR